MAIVLLQGAYVKGKKSDCGKMLVRNTNCITVCITIYIIFSSLNYDRNKSCREEMTCYSELIMTTIKPKWTMSDKTIVIVFNVGRGLAIFIRMPNNKCMIYDMGSSSDFSPAEIVKKKFIETGYIKGVSQLFVSHPHKDHFDESDKMVFDTLGNIDIEYVTMPNFENFKEGMGAGRMNEQLDESFLLEQTEKEVLDRYKKIYGKRRPPLVIFPDAISCGNSQIECGLFYMRPPEVKTIHESSPQDYGNGTSLCLYYRHNSHAIWVPGDITPAVMSQMLIPYDNRIERRYASLNATRKLAEQSTLYSYDSSRTSNNPNLAELLSDSNIKLINVAAHHGLSSCYSEEFFEVAKPIVNIISERSKDNGGVDARYSNHDKGVYVKSGVDCSQDSGGKRKSLTTRKDGHILMILGGDGDPVFYHSTDIELIINAMNELA